MNEQNGGAALIGDPETAIKIIQAVKSVSKLPVSVKTRTGQNFHNTEAWIKTILSAEPDAITLHGRTGKMMYKGLADWEQIKLAADLAHQAGVVIIGNGDITSLEKAYDYASKYSVDGIMIGRALLDNPFIFLNDFLKSFDERLNILKMHSEFFIRFWNDEKGISMLKKYFKSYLSEFPKASEIRHQFMQIKTKNDLFQLIYELEKTKKL